MGKRQTLNKKDGIKTNINNRQNNTKLKINVKKTNL